MVALSILSGAHMTLVPRVIALLRAQEAGDIMVLVGGTIPDVDILRLKEAGVAAVFGPGTDTREVVQYLRTQLSTRA